MATSNPLRRAWDIFTNVQRTQQAPQVVQIAAAPPAQAQTQSDPLAEMAALLKTGNTANKPADPLAGPVLNSDPVKIAEAASKLDMTARVDPEILKRVAAGNDPAAIAELVNAVAQQTLATAANLSAATTEQGLQRQATRIMQALPARVKQLEIDGVAVVNPALAHEASAPILRMVRQQIADANPNMSPVAINAQAEALLINHAQVVASTTESPGFRQGGLPAQQQSGQRETDWNQWAGF